MNDKRKKSLRNSIIADSLKHKIDSIQVKVTPLLSRTTNINIDYTEHTVEHSLNIEELLGECFTEIISILNDDEKFLLISATLIHDIGMVGQSKYQDDKDYPVEVRDSHQYRSADFVNAYREDLMLDQREAQAIIKIVEGHRVRDLESIAESEPYGYGYTIRPRLLAALLRMGDELDILEERAPELVKKYLDVNPESLIHHERHEICTGIARDPETNIISIKAIIPNSPLEHAVNDLFNGIKAKFAEVEPILTKSGILVKDIGIILDTEQVVAQEICLYLACKGRTNEQDIITNFESTRKQHEIVEAIKRLKSKRILKKDDEDNYFLNSDKEHFRILLNTFLRTQFELDFTKSMYVRNYLEDNFVNYAISQFGVAFLEGDKDDRILLLTHFPTSLEYFFDPRSTPYEFGNFDRKVTLDLGLLHAFSVDVIKYPQELKSEIYLAAQAIGKTISDNFFSFLKICSSIPAAVEKRRELIELYNQGISPCNKDNDEYPVGKFTVTTTTTKNQLPNMDFMTLLFASEIAGVPVEFSKDITMKDIEFGPNTNFEEVYNKGDLFSLKVIPNVDHENFKMSVLFDFDINQSRRELSMRLQKDIKADSERSPYELNISSQGNEYITFNLNCNMSGKISEIIRFNTLMNLWNEEGFRRLSIFSGLEGQEPIKIVPPNISKKTGPFINNFKRIITRINIDTDECPYLIKVDTFEKIEKLGETELAEDMCSEIIKDIKDSIPKKITKLYLDMVDREENILSTKCLGIVPYWFDLTRFNFKYYNKNYKDSIKDIYDRKNTISIRKYCFSYSMQELFDLIVYTFEHNGNYPIEKVFKYLFEDTGELAQFIVLINFEAKKTTYWQEEQTIFIRIKQDNEEIDKINRLNKLLSQNNNVDAIPLMEELGREGHLENLAFAYCQKGEYDKSIDIANAAIERNRKSIAHFTKGLSLVLSDDLDSGFKSYMNGVFLVDNKIWYPLAIDNLKSFLINNDIEINDAITHTVERMEFYSRFNGKKINKKCFCGSKKPYSSCCGKQFFN